MCIYIYIYVCIYNHMYVCVSICIYIYMYIAWAAAPTAPTAAPQPRVLGFRVWGLGFRGFLGLGFIRV